MLEELEELAEQLDLQEAVKQQALQRAEAAEKELESIKAERAQTDVVSALLCSTGPSLSMLVPTPPVMLMRGAAPFSLVCFLWFACCVRYEQLFGSQGEPDLREQQGSGMSKVAFQEAAVEAAESQQQVRSRHQLCYCGGQVGCELCMSKTGRFVLLVYAIVIHVSFLGP